MRLTVCLMCFCIGLIVSSPTAFAEPMDYSFTYQGQLQDSGSPANGLHDFLVTPVDGLGVDLGPTVALGNVNVVDGLFTLDIDFGNILLTTEKVYLKILVGTAGGASVELLPHTLLHSSPFAIQAQEATLADVALTSLDNEFARAGNDLRLGDTDDRLLLNPDLSGNNMLNSSTLFQINTNTPWYGGMYINKTDASSIPFYGFASNNMVHSWIEADTNANAMNFFFVTEASPSLIIEPAKVSMPYIAVDSTVQAGGDIIQDYGNNNYHYATPMAYGTFFQSGNMASGTDNLSAVWNAGLSRYELTIAGEFFTFIGHTVSVTPAGSTPRLATTDSASEKLLVYIFDLNGNQVQGSFQVIIYDNNSISVE